MTIFMYGVGVHLLIYSFARGYFWTPPQLSTETGMSKIQALTPRSRCPGYMRNCIYLEGKQSQPGSPKKAVSKWPKGRVLQGPTGRGAAWRTWKNPKRRGRQ